MPDPKPAESRICDDCRETFTAKYARWCPNCRWRHRGRYPKKRIWTPEHDAYLFKHWDIRNRRSTTKIAAHFGWPRWAINKRAQHLGLARSKEPLWTAHWMFMHLPAPRRTETAIIVKLKRLVGSRRVTDGGYTVGQLEALLGIDHRVLDQYGREGKLRVQMRGYNTTRDTWCVDPVDVRAFIRKHRDLYDLRRVDQPTFLALIFDEAAPKVETRAHRSKRAA
jgi:hypothetical protein